VKNKEKEAKICVEIPSFNI